MRQLVRRVPIDAVALIAIALVTCATHLPYIRHGMCWNDPSWLFHFGHRTLEGAVPYRDYVYQVGPLPVYVDAGFQEIFGAKYAASLYAALFIKILRIWVMWLIARRLADRHAAALLVVFCMLDATFSFAHHWSTQYSGLFITTSGLFFVLASRAEGRRELAYLALAGASAALVTSARQSSAVTIGIVMLAATAVMFARRQYFTRARFIALWGGFAAGIVVLFAALAVVGALGPAIQQMFLDAPQKKNIHGITAVLDAISGGALVDIGFSWWGGFLTFLALPTVVVVSIGWLGSRERQVSTRTLALLAFPFFLVVGLATRYSSLLAFSDLPRMLLSATTIFAIVYPDKLRTWVGLEPIVAIGLGALPLASDWALEMSFPGRGWGDSWALVAGGILITLATKQLAARMKLAICGALAVMGLVHFAVLVRVHANPFALSDSADGTLRENKLASKHPMLRGMRLAAWRVGALDALSSVVPAGSTCFVYGNFPVLYDLLDCTNPTHVDTTAADFITGDDANAAIEALRAHPPEFLIAAEKQWMNPPLNTARGPHLDDYGDSLNPPASMAMHVGLRAMLDQYEDLGTVGERLGPDLAGKAAVQRDFIDQIRIYRRKQ